MSVVGEEGRTVGRHTAAADEQAESARRRFLEEVAAIPGVVAVHPLPGSSTVRVSVADRFGDAPERVYDLEERLLGRVPRARLDVWISAVP